MSLLNVNDFENSTWAARYEKKKQPQNAEASKSLFGSVRILIQKWLHVAKQDLKKRSIIGLLTFKRKNRPIE